MQGFCDETYSVALSWQERLTLKLRRLFGQYGYKPFRMGKFEEYDLYANARDFLVSGNIISFSDTDGKLMALKPDVTLSIIKNSTGFESGVTRLYYNENVYRTAKGSPFFKELMQVGLECLGNIDDYCRFEVLMLAAKSLLIISPSAVLDISHLGILKEVISRFEVSKETEKKLLACIGQKNSHELKALCREAGAADEEAQVLLALAATSGQPQEVLARIDFSVATGSAYYNGIVFEGFVEGVPERVLSGGQYDRMMRKMGHDAGAIGFALYLDTLERQNDETASGVLDAVVVYDESSSAALIGAHIEQLAAEGKAVVALREDALSTCGLSWKQLIRIRKGKVVREHGEQ